MIFMSFSRFTVGIAFAVAMVAVRAQAQEVPQNGVAFVKQSEDVAPPSLNPLNGLTMGEMRYFLDRPLFAESRQPFRPPPPLPINLPPSDLTPFSTLRLVGTIQTPAGWLALIQQAPGGFTQTVPEGRSIDGWTVSSIGSRAVRIVRDTNVLDLLMFSALSPTAPTPGTVSERAVALPSPAIGQPATREAASLTMQIEDEKKDIAVQALPASETLPSGIVPGSAAAQAIATSTDKLTFGATTSAPAMP